MSASVFVISKEPVITGKFSTSMSVSEIGFWLSFRLLVLLGCFDVVDIVVDAFDLLRSVDDGC